MCQNVAKYAPNMCQNMWLKIPLSVRAGRGFFVPLLGLSRTVVPRLHASVRMFFKDDAVGRDAASGIRKAAGEGRSAVFRAFAGLDDAPGDFDQRGVESPFGGRSR